MYMKRELNKKKKILVLNSSVFFKKSNDKLFIYNSENGYNILETSSVILDFFIKNKHPFYNYLTLPNNISNKKIESFIDYIISNLFGFVLQVDEKINPVQFSPNVLKYFLDNSKEGGVESDYGLRNLFEISIFYDKNSISQNLFFESLDINIPQNTTKEINNHKIIDFIFPALKLKSIYKINFYLDSLVIPNFNKAIKHIRGIDKNLQIVYHFSYKYFVEIYNGHLPLFFDNNTYFSLYINSLINKKEFTIFFDNIDQNILSKVRFQFVVENLSDKEFFDAILERLKIKNYQFKPFYNRKNLDFFKKNIFLEQSDILNLKPNSLTITKNQYLNILNFGRLFILPNGDIYANLYHNKVGNVYNNRLNEIIKQEISNSKSWLNVRRLVEPCKNCVFEIVCSPISNYEYALKKIDLCNL